MPKANPAPGFKEYPEHRVETRPASVHVRVTYQGEVIADTRDARRDARVHGRGKKTAAPVVYYIPRKDVKMDRLARTAHRTHCPFKGDASYFSLVDGPENGVWSYEAPYDEMLAIKAAARFLPGQVPDLGILKGEVMAYVDGFVVPVPKKNLAKYKAMARKSELGAQWDVAADRAELVGRDQHRLVAQGAADEQAAQQGPRPRLGRPARARRVPGAAAPPRRRRSGRAGRGPAARTRPACPARRRTPGARRPRPLPAAWTP